MRLAFPWILLLAITTATGAVGPAWAETVGQVDRARGEAVAVRQAQAVDLASGGDVRFEDTLRTGVNSRLYVTFADDSRLMMGDQSEIIVDAMVYSPDRFGAGALRLTEGVFRMVSGQVNKVPGGTLSIATPFATIGVRGTDFWGEQTAERLLMALLDDGELTITTSQGTVTLTDPKTAVLIERGRAPGAVFSLSDQQLQDAVATISW